MAPMLTTSIAALTYALLLLAGTAITYPTSARTPASPAGLLTRPVEHALTDTHTHAYGHVHERAVRRRQAGTGHMGMEAPTGSAPAVGQLGHLPGTKCPVCGTANSNAPGSTGYFVNVKNGTQKIFTCSQEHAKLVLEAPTKYVNMTATPTPIGNTTAATANKTTTYTRVVPQVGPYIECPFCKMESVKEHAIHFNHGQALYACQMPPHNALLQNETALTSKFSGLVPVAATKCPVCASPVNKTDGLYVSVKNGTQKIFVCSEEHGRMVMEAPLTKYFMSAATPVKATNTTGGAMAGHGGMGNMTTGNFTFVQPAVECPFCKMDGVMEHSIKLKHGQALYACSMPPHNAMLQLNETALVAKFSGLVRASGQPEPGKENSGKGSGGVRVQAPGVVAVAVAVVAVLVQ